MNLKGCFHTERPKTKFCTNCGSGLCYECYIEEELGSRVTASTSIDMEVRKDFGFFCPSCYIERINQSNYRIPREARTHVTLDPNKKPTFYNPFSFSSGTPLIVNLVGIAWLVFALLAPFIIPFGMGWIITIVIVPLWGILLFLDYRRGVKAFEKFEIKKQKALDLLKEHRRSGARQKRKEDEEPLPHVKRCRYCGVENKSDQTSCKNCGAPL